MRKLPGVAIKNTEMEKPSKIEAGSTVIDSRIGRYSYCGYDCIILNAEIGRFSSISDDVVIGQARHPINWVSTSPAFYKGRDSIPKNLATLTFDSSPERTIIGNDVWIGARVMVKSGVRIGDGAVIGMGSIVTKDVPSYEIWAGNPAKKIKDRFPPEIKKQISVLQWWNLCDDELKLASTQFDHVQNSSANLMERVSLK